MKKMKMLIAALMMLVIALPLGCMAEETIVPAATPAPVMLNQPEPTPQWLTVIDTWMVLNRHDYVEEIGHISHTIPATCFTTHLAELFVEYMDVCEAGGMVDYSTSQHLEFELKTRVTAPDGMVTENTRTEEPIKSGVDEHEHFIEGETLRKVFSSMMEEKGSIDPGLYLYESFIDGILVATHSFNVLESEYTPGYADHDTRLYDSPDCLGVISVLPGGEDVKILDIKPSESLYRGYVFEVEWNDQTGYVKCYDIMPVCDDSLMGKLASEKMEGLRVEYIDNRIDFGERYGYGITCMTRGQAEYCVKMEDVGLIKGISYSLNRSFIPEGLGKATATIRDRAFPNRKPQKVELQDASAKTAQESVKKVFGQLKGKLDGQYEVSVEIGGEEYACYSVNYWSEGFYVEGGHSSALDISICTRVTLPDRTVREVRTEQQTWRSLDDRMYNSFEDMALEEIFGQMMDESGIQAGIYTVEVFIENSRVDVSEFEVLDEDMVLVLVNEPTPMFDLKTCKKVIGNVSGGAVVQMETGKTTYCEVPSRYGDWMDEHLAFIAEHKGQKGYIDGENIRMLTDEKLPEYIQKLLTVRERPDWMSLAIASPSTSNAYMTGSITDEVMTLGSASLAAEHKAYKIRTYVYYSLKEDRNAQFEIKITRPDGVTFERKESHEPNYNMEDKSQFSDYSICDMLKQMKEKEGILPGSYHYEIRETGSGMYMDGWFEILDVELAMGETKEDARLYASPNRSRVIAEIPIYSDIFLYDDYRCEHASYNSDYGDTTGYYIARVSWNGLMGYMDQQDYHTEAQEGEELLERLGEETVAIESLELVYSEGRDGEFVETPLEAPLEYDQISRMLGSYGEVSVHAQMTYTSPLTEQLMLFTFMVQAPSGGQMAMSEMYVYFDKPGRASSENVLIDGGSIVTLLERMGSQGMVEKGIYQYSVMMNGEVLAQTQFEVAPQGNYGAYYSSNWDSEDEYGRRMNIGTADSAHEDTDAAYNAQVSASYDETAETEASVSGEFGTVKIREGSSVNVRKKSNADSERVGIVKGGAEYPCMGIADNGWYQIELEDGTVGYVSNKMALLIQE